jgi:CheY-like chemotaxis protein
MDEFGQIKNCLQVLHLEDNPVDAELIKESLADHSIPCHITQIHSRQLFEVALQKGNADLILSDSSLPDFDGLSAVSLAKERLPDIPFIFVSGSLSPKTKAEAFMRGATDFISKDDLPKLSRIIHWLFFLNQRKHPRRALPETGTPVTVQCQGFCCLGFLDRHGVWRDFATSSELPNVIDWSEL